MKLRLLYFASLREQLGTGGEEVAVPEGVSTVEGLRAYLMARDVAWGAALAPQKSLRVAVNQVMSQPDSPLKSGDEVAFFPPVTGG